MLFKKLAVVLVVSMILVLAGCYTESKQPEPSKDEKSGDKKAAKAEKKKKKKELETQAGFEAKLAEMGFPIYEDAEFEKVEKKRSKYSAVYKIPELSEDASKKVKAFYADCFKKMKESGWKSVMEETGHFDYLYSKDGWFLTFTHKYIPEYKINSMYISIQKN